MGVVRVTEQQIAAAGSVQALIKKLLESAKVGPMELREKAVAAIRSLSDQQVEHAKLIGKSTENGCFSRDLFVLLFGKFPSCAFWYLVVQ